MSKDDRKKKSGKFRSMGEDYPGFEKFRKSFMSNPDYPQGADDEAINKINSQQFGSGHLVEDSKVLFDGERPDTSYKGYRPGVVGISPSKGNGFLTGWYPCSTGSFKRKQSDTVFLSSSEVDIEKNCYILLRYRQFFKYHTLSEKKFEIPERKKTELKTKMNNLEG